MTSLCMYFQVHQPFRLRRFWPDDRPGFFRYFDERSNREIFERVARNVISLQTELFWSPLMSIKGIQVFPINYRNPA